MAPSMTAAASDRSMPEVATTKVWPIDSTTRIAAANKSACRLAMLRKTGWAMPLLAHCLVHLAVATTLILIIAPKFWFIAVIDFVIHITVDRAKGFCASTFGVTQENKHPWFWTLIGIDQALHHLTGFGLAVFMAANG